MAEFVSIFVTFLDLYPGGIKVRTKGDFLNVHRSAVGQLLP